MRNARAAAVLVTLAALPVTDVPMWLCRRAVRPSKSVCNVPLLWQDPDFLAGLIRRAGTVTVRDGQSQALDLKVGGR
jgi:hypothetical protein